MGYERSIKRKARVDMERVSLENEIFIQKLVFLLEDQQPAPRKSVLESDWL